MKKIFLSLILVNFLIISSFADGNITRFTGLSKANWNSYMSSAEAEYKDNHSDAPVEGVETTSQEKVVI